MKILAIHVQSHDTGVALVQDGEIIYAAANERFSRIKMDRRVPLKALKNCLNYTKTKPQDLDKVVFVGDSFPKSLWCMFKESSWALTNSRGRYLLFWRKPHLILWRIILATGVPGFLYRVLLPEWKIKQALKGYEENYSYTHHHFAHLYSAYYTSGWDKCLVACFEGSGFDETFSIYQVKNKKWTKITQNRLPHSAGKFYELVTLLLGFNIWRHPGKITGLAAFGNPNIFYKHVKDLLKVKGMNLEFDYNYYLKWFINYLVNKSIPDVWKKNKREDIAAAFQRRLEECVVEIIQKAVKLTGESKVALAGGVIGNVKLNQKIHEIPEISEIHINQAMGDDGLVIGASLDVASKSGGKIKRLEDVYLGPDFTNGEIISALRKYKLKFSKEKNIEKRIAELLADNKVVARFNGRMEYGPRALGNRSILYHAKDKTVNDWLNKRLKRTEFMPFAPVTLDRFAKKCYKNIDGAEHPARFMTITLDCTEFMRKISPAVVHVDGTARPQIIRKQDNPSYYKIIEEYYKLTGIPSLINTSFNMHEEPIVCTPSDAARSFISGNLDYLAIGNYLVSA